MNQKSRIRLSVIIPCYNEAEVIQETATRLTKVLSTPKLKNHELIFINDGSSDNTLEILRNIAKHNRRIKIIGFSRNFGHQPAVTAGIHHAQGDVAIIIDADLQDPPELIPEMMHIYESRQCNVVFGVRRNRKGESYFKKLTAKLFYRAINSLSDVSLPLDTGDFRLIDRNVMREFNRLREKHKYIRGLISWIGFKQEPMYYEREARFAGETKYPISKMIRFATSSLLYFTKKPLKLAITSGLSCIAVGIALTLYVFWSKYLDPENTASGWASTLITIIFFGGVQLLTIGVLGEYIGSIFDEIKDRPEYIIQDKVNL